MTTDEINKKLRYFFAVPWGTPEKSEAVRVAWANCLDESTEEVIEFLSKYEFNVPDLLVYVGPPAYSSWDGEHNKFLRMKWR